jgi:hypothetical protein
LVAEVARLLKVCSSTDDFATRISDVWINQLTIAGDPTPTQCAAKISQLHQIGANSVVLAEVSTIQ